MKNFNSDFIPIDRRVWKGSLLLAVLVIFFLVFYKPFAYFFAFIFAFHLYFFRIPKRILPGKKGPISPADGVVMEVSDEFENRYIKDNAVKIGIFLSVLDVHVNFSPVSGKVGYLEHRPGKFLNALSPESLKENECQWMGIEESRGRVLVRQIAGLIARRIYCDATIDEVLERGEQFGIICYSSRAEFWAPKKNFRPLVHVGQRVKAGQTLLGNGINKVTKRRKNEKNIKYFSFLAHTKRPCLGA
jgi:phosphatidylserine decarboxylase